MADAGGKQGYNKKNKDIRNKWQAQGSVGIYIHRHSHDGEQKANALEQHIGANEGAAMLRTFATYDAQLCPCQQSVNSAGEHGYGKSKPHWYIEKKKALHGEKQRPKED